ncbi:phosphonate C-P lyase system protein PhnL [Acidiphilium sp. JA12-A1]|uniref:phosphonate C-P lyase system protein PhnL n=1 Tax=Acidiphilium sp. JA12-A1 TaxID=1464546 RepID=UPI000460DE5A|nr:phosphonate C-P lyase system protein PhnL [Acidiphilium sp. JA12-A1]KDM66937.1 alpha-D-ribose 1-methylphosphonate 5-triphosphate synthase subunit PhnL [Acidiphilium sp. JA12-A1]
MIVLDAAGLEKTFVLHLQNGTRLPVLRGAGLTLRAGRCVALTGPSGAGKSTLLRALYGNYRVSVGSIRVRHRGAMIDMADAPPERVIEIRRETLGYVSQFLRAMPRLAARDVVAAPLLDRGAAAEAAAARAGAMLDRLGIPTPLHALPPVTFSGGEQQRVNLARAFACEWPILLLDEPTASLDAANRDIVIGLMREAKARGAALLGIFHDRHVRDAVADETLSLEPLKESA